MAKTPPMPDILGDLLGRDPTKTQKININAIRVDGGTQMRAGLNEATVQEYYDTLYTQERVTDWPFPPIVVFHDGQDNWLADGFHRLEAIRRLLKDNQVHEIPADIRAGTRRDAILHAAGANANHGLRRSQADKRRSVETMLRDEEWRQWSDREIARSCNVSADLVGTVRRELAPPVTVGNDSEPPVTRTFVTKYGTPATMQVSNINAKREPSYAGVWALERTVSNVVTRNPGTGDASAVMLLRQAATDNNAGLRRMIEDALDDGNIEFRGRDLVQAIHNVAAQLEQKLRREQTPTVDVPIKLAPSSNNVPYVTSPEESEQEHTQTPVTVVSDSETPAAPVDDTVDIPVSFRSDYDSDEWYTAEEITRTAHHVMGSIDLDPATCELAQTVVQAGTYYTKVDDGLAQPWTGNVWLNPPYSAPQVWIDKLFAEMASGAVTQAIVLVNNATETAWFQRLLTESKLVCFPARRLAFWRHDHSNAAGRQGQALFYFGNRAEQFYSAFSATGAVLRRLSK